METPDGSVWIASGGLGLEQWDGTELIPHLDGVWTGSVFLGPDGMVGVDAWDGTHLFDGVDWRLVSSRQSGYALSDDGVLAVRGNGDGGMRLYRDDRTAAVLDGTRVNSIADAPDGSIWIVGSVGRNRGAVYRIDPDEVFAAQETAAGADEMEPAEDATST